MNWIELPDEVELERLSGVRFSERDLAELVDLVSIYANRFHPDPEPTLDFMLVDAVLLGSTDRDARRAFIEAVEGVWRSRSSKPHTLGSYFDPEKKYHDGPLIRLLLRLFEAMGGPVPAASTLHDDLVSSGRGDRKR